MDGIADIKARLDVVDIVGEYVQLKPAGSGSFKACCPFHQEKTPSFMVNRPRQSWHCFGCNIGGDMFSFVEKIEGMEFVEALELLAQKAGVQLPHYDHEAMGAKKRLQEINAFLSKLMRHILLTDPEAEIARAYVAKRGIDDLTADLWQIGYAPSDWTPYQKKLQEKGYNAADLIQVGFALQKENGQGIHYRFFRRLMFPIADQFGNVAGFTGRLLTEEKAAKYVNTPETALYKKSHILYGLDKAKSDVKRQDLAVIVEGNMDALTSHQFGVTNVVASSGTALTAEQLQLIKRYTNNLAMAFDMDDAGLNAALRGLDLARQMDFNVKLIRYDQNTAKDPDELIRKNLEFWKDAIRDANPIMEWAYRHAFTVNDSHTPEGKKSIAQFILNECRHIQHPVERDAWISKLARDLDVSPDSLRQAMPANQVGNKTPTPSRGSVKYFNTDKSGPRLTGTALKDSQQAQKMDTAQDLEALWLALVLARPQAFVPFEMTADHSPHVKLYKCLEKQYNSRVLNGDQPTAWDMEPLNQDAETKGLVDFLAILADREFPDRSPEAMEAGAADMLKRLKDRSLAERRLELETAMREAERQGDTDRILQLLQQFNSLT